MLVLWFTYCSSERNAGSDIDLSNEDHKIGKKMAIVYGVTKKQEGKMKNKFKIIYDLDIVILNLWAVV